MILKGLVHQRDLQKRAFITMNVVICGCLHDGDEIHFLVFSVSLFFCLLITVSRLCYFLRGFFVE